MKLLLWRGDNVQEFIQALAAFEIMVSPDGDKLYLAAPGKSMAPLELGDELIVHENGIEIKRPPTPSKKAERWMVWNGKNLQEVIDFVEWNDWQVGLKVQDEFLLVKGYRGQKQPTVLRPGDTIVENNDGLWFRRKESTQ